MKSFCATVLLAAGVSANPFAAKMTKNTVKANYIGSLMRSAQTIRKLEDEEVEVDISTYSIKFEKCQFIKQYNGGENRGNENADTVLATKHFVIFRLCPDNSCDSCNYNYGEYIVDMETYLETTLGYKEEQQENYCQACDECNNGDDGNNNNNNQQYNANVDCTTCYDECQNIENMEDNGYLDAAEYTECQNLYEDNYGNAFYAGPVCASTGTRIKIGVFLDEECSVYDADLDVETYLNMENDNNNNGVSMKLSYHLLKQTFSEGECIASCTVEAEDDGDNDGNNGDDEVEINEVCQELYEAAGKCETSHGFQAGIDAYQYSANYANQASQEDLVCNFISSISAGHFDQSGEISVSGGRTTLGSASITTGGQKFALTFFVLGSVGLAGYAAMLHSQLTKGAKADLSRQGGAMA